MKARAALRYSSRWRISYRCGGGYWFWSCAQMAAWRKVRMKIWFQTFFFPDTPNLNLRCGVTPPLSPQTLLVAKFFGVCPSRSVRERRLRSAYLKVWSQIRTNLKLPLATPPNHHHYHHPPPTFPPSPTHSSQISAFLAVNKKLSQWLFHLVFTVRKKQLYVSRQANTA